MKTNLIALILAASALSACGGGGGGNGAGGSSANYSYVVPPLGETSTYAYAIIDVNKDSASYSYKSKVTTVNTDGSYVKTWNPLQTSYMLGTILIGLDGEIDTYNSAGYEVQYTPSDQLNFTCHYAVSGPPVSLTPGQTFSTTTTTQCTGGTSTSYTNAGTYVGTESITVPAGTFTAYKFQYSNSYFANSTLGAGGGTITDNTTSWYDTSATSTRLIRATTQTSYSSFTPAGTSNLSFDMQLTSTQ